LLAIERTPADDAVMFDLFRNAAIKSFELSLETAGKLLREALKSYGGSPRGVDAWVFNDVLRQAGKHGLLDEAGVERWLAYRANRNTTAHDYGEGFANITLKLLPVYLSDVRALAAPLQRVFDAAG
jgi:nucleotidyltransferase substrate binding protein (TIGR01987 family)